MSWLYHTNSLGTRVDRRLHEWSRRRRSWRTATGRHAATATKQTISSGLTDSKFKEVIAAERVYFRRYPGYVTTMMGPQASKATLERVQKKMAK